MYKKYWSIIVSAIWISILVAGCGTLEVGIETDTSPTLIVNPGSTEDISTPTSENTPVVESSTPSAETQPTETASPAETVGPGFPDLVTIGILTPYGSSDIGVLVLQDGELTVQPSPVYYEVFWDYSPVSGRIAYSPEFVHGSDHNNVSVTSLWVYELGTGASEMWLDDNVIRAAWSPDGEKVTAAVYNPQTEQVELVFVTGPDQVEVISDCASNLFSWSPDGSQLAFVNAVSWAGVKPACAGTYLVSFPNGISAAEHEQQRVSDFGSEALMSGDYNDQPIWAVEQNALIYPDQPFWVIPLDGSPAFIPATPDGEDPLELPRPFGGLWSAGLTQLVGYYDAGMSGQGGVWVYQLSDDLGSIESYDRIGDGPFDGNSFITLVDWWVPGESILVLNGDNPDTSQYLSEYWPSPAIWSLIQKDWLDYPSE